MCNYVLCALLLLLINSHIAESAWSYEEGNWSKNYSVCGSDQQSPIDLIPVSTVLNTSLTEKPLQFLNYDAVQNYTQFDIINNGHTVQVTLRNVNYTIGMFNGGLSNIFTLEQFHFHWGKEADKGSEHTVDGAAYPQELHLVHFNSDKYHNVSEGQNQTDGLAVLGVFIQLSEENNPAFDKIIQYFQNITYENFDLKDIEKFAINDLLPNNTKEFYRYRGSLTTPPCYQSVQWTVLRHPLLISDRQLEAFRTLFANETGHNTEPIEDNFRPTQHLNNRIVSRSFDTTDVDWGYGTLANGPNTWKNLVPECGRYEQSPVNIVTANTSTQDLGMLAFGGTGSRPATFNLSNTGRAVELLPGAGWTVSQGSLQGSYVLDKIVFHWGENDSSGSEHTVDDKVKPLEIQFMYHQNTYNNLTEAIKHDQGVAIVAVFASIVTTSNNTALDTITQSLKNVTLSDNSTAITSFDLLGLLPTNKATYYRYNGSLTTPNCEENVVWTVYSDTVGITSTQVALFRSVKISGVTGADSYNYRPPQPLHDRHIIRSETKQPVTTTQPPVSSAVRTDVSTIATFTLALSVLAAMF